MENPGVIFAAISILLAIYFIPTIVACNREHPSKAAIFVLNIFLGWTFLGWVIALVWSFTSTKQVLLITRQAALLKN
ncbi:MAG: superinfection immunity protein [Candidatus Loosdrechtia sp.]|uniref:superinfection immunity protein n=1 Tax=Candidatus Loosdrechtia sp. TaxID=3101272 RepID=UPI003A74CEF5|nr:MAG: superinfection immunity protein [Candidatus Jettenia sp. AMX2]